VACKKQTCGCGKTLFDPELYAQAIENSVQLKANQRKRNPKSIDPTRTTTLQNQFVRAINRRLAALLKEIRTGIVTNDTFGLGPAFKRNQIIAEISQDLAPGAFAFETDAAKIKAFEDWLDDRVENGVLAVDSNGDRFSDDFIRRAADAGTRRAQEEVAKAGPGVAAAAQGTAGATALAGGASAIGATATSAGTSLPLALALGGGIPAERVAALYTRTFNELRGLTDDMKNRMRRELAEGLAAGENPRQVARRMSQVIGISRRRARTIARTEIVRAHHTGNITELKRLGIEGVGVRAEWVTAGDDRVCPDCAALEGRVFKIEQIEALIPLHPNCRCVAVPLVEGGTPPSGMPEGDFVTKKSDGSPRGKPRGLFEEATGGAKNPGFTFPGQDPVKANEAQISTILEHIEAEAGTAVAQLFGALAHSIRSELKANHDLLKGDKGESIRGIRGFTGATGATGPAPQHEIKGNSIRFQNPDGTWGDWIDSPKGDKGVRGYTGSSGKDGFHGNDGVDGKDGKRGKVGRRGMRGPRGRDGRIGGLGPMPDHELKLNAEEKVVAIRFQRPGNKWGAWLHLNDGEAPLPDVPTGVRDIKIRGRRICFQLPNGQWTDWIRFGGGGGGGTTGILGVNVEQDGSSILEAATSLNFSGGVTVTDEGDGTASIQIADVAATYLNYFHIIQDQVVTIPDRVQSLIAGERLNEGELVINGEAVEI